MELQTALLSSDLEHLAINFRLLSKEFINLQEFIQQEFGSKFVAFCNAKKEQRGLRTPSVATPARSASSVKRPCPKSKKADEAPETSFVKKEYSNSTSVNTIRSYKVTSSDVEQDASDFNADDTGMLSDGSNNADDDDNFFTMTSADNFNEDEDEDPEELPLDISLLYENDPEHSSRRGKHKSIVHRYFKVVTVNDGSCKAKCKKCGGYVSKQAQRMRNHLMKCLKDEKGTKLNKLIKKLNLPTEVETGAQDSNKGRGRKLDKVRLLFTSVKKGSGKCQMKCNQCGMTVSNQAIRLKNHILNRCPNREKLLSKFGSSESDSDEHTPTKGIRKSNRKRRKKHESESESDEDDTNDEVDITEHTEESANNNGTTESNERNHDAATSGNDNGQVKPFLTICSNDLLEVASNIETG